MSKAIFSALMFAMLCTGNLSPDNVNNYNNLKHMQTVAHYQLDNQHYADTLNNHFDDDEDEEETVS